jgi:hypothetical protein
VSPLRIWLVGFGTVGRWLAGVLDLQAERLAARYGLDAVVVGIANTRDGFVYDQDGVSLALARVGAGRLAEAERALRETLRMCAQSPVGRSGTSGVAELRLAEVILAGGDAGRAGKAAGLLEAIRPQVEEQRLFRNVVFRFLLAPARAARLRRDPAAPAVSPTR